MDDEGEPAFLRLLNAAKKKGPRSLQYIGGLMELGMYYNRVNRFEDATRVLTQALAIVDSGAVKPSPKTAPVPPLVQHHPGGVVSATNMNPPKPYEELMQNLMPALVQAEMNSGRMAQAESHIKRMIALAASDPVSGKLNLMSAYTAYAELCRKQGREREAAAYQKKADDINATFIGL
jgi:tetratricopeptide (TPR) repeat protein